MIGATLGAFMAVLNIQIVNASLADIQGAIGAGVDDSGWISTSYLIAEIVVIPLSGWLSQVFSLRLYLLANAALFLLFSVGCAFAQDLGQMIVLRAIQGFSGGVLIPMAFTLIITLLPKGLEIAQRIYERHTFLEAWLMRLGVAAKTAEADACKIEHDLHPETFAASQKYVSATLDQYSAK